MNILLIDAKYMLYVQHWAHDGLQNREQFPTGGIFGFLKEILKLHEQWKCSMIFCWDGQGPNWKKKGGTGYKANREISPGVLQVQQQETVLRRLLDAVGFHSLCVRGVEGDDLIGLLAYGPWKDGDPEIRIYSGDQDMYQLVGERVRVWRKIFRRGHPAGMELVNAGMVENIMGVPPGEVCEIRAMAGDSSDNLKGLKGIGPKKALDLYVAGLRPSYPIGLHDPQGQLLIRESGWHLEWERINTEYKLMKIPVRVDAPHWETETQRELETAINEVCADPRRKGGDRDYWLKFLGKYELEEMWKVRGKIFEIK